MKARLIKETDLQGRPSWCIQIQEEGYKTWVRESGTTMYDELSAEMIWDKFMKLKTTVVTDVIKEVEI